MVLGLSAVWLRIRPSEKDLCSEEGDGSLARRPATAHRRYHFSRQMRPSPPPEATDEAPQAQRQPLRTDREDLQEPRRPSFPIPSFLCLGEGRWHVRDGLNSTPRTQGPATMRSGASAMEQPADLR